MVAPTVNTIDPTVGRTIGQQLVTITGTDFNLTATGTVSVLFGTKSATEIRVNSSTEIECLTPTGTPGDTVDVTVTNVPLVGAPEPTVVVDAFTYHRPRIETRRDYTQDGAIICVCRKIVQDMRQFVIKNTHFDMHPEYVFPSDLTQEAQAPGEVRPGPSLKIMGPEVTEEDGDYRFQGRVQIDDVPTVSFKEYHWPITVRLGFDYTGYGRTKGESWNLFEALSLYFRMTPDLEVFVNGVDDTDGTSLYEIHPLQDQRARFRSEATRQARFQFTGAFEIRGVPLHLDQVGKGPKIQDPDTDLILNPEQIPPT